MLHDGDTFEHAGHKFRFRTEHDDTMGAPWEEHDGHGIVSDPKYWAPGQGVKPPKRPGERILYWDRGYYRTYDWQESMKLARKDGWGPPAYRVDIEHGANGLHQASGQWFIGRSLLHFVSDWCDDQNDAVREVYAKLKAHVTPGQYAAMAIEADFERMRRWCNDEWHWCGVVVSLLDDEGDPMEGYEASLWGIESDAGYYFAEVATDLAEDVLAQVAKELAA